MKNKTHILIASLFMLVCVRGYAVNLDDGLIPNGSYTNGTEFVSMGGSPGNTNVNINLSGTITFGGDEQGYSATINRINTEGGVNTTINITQATGGSKNIHLTVDRITPDAASPLEINIENGTGTDWNSRNTLVVNQLEKNGSTTINVSQRAAFVLNTADNLGDGGGAGNFFELNLDGGQASLAGGSVLVNGSIGGWGELAVGSGLKIGSSTATDTTSATFSVDTNKTLNVTTTLGGAANGNLTFGTSGSGTVTMDINGTLNAGAIVIAKDGTITMIGSNGVINAGSLTVNNSDFKDAAGVAVRVSGLATVAKDAVYTVRGDNDEFRGGMNLNGILSSDADAEIAFGTGPNALAALNITGGQIRSGANDFTIHYADIRITTGTASTAGSQTVSLDATGGKLNLATSNVTVNLSKTANTKFNATQGIDINNYAQISGSVDLTGSGAMVVGGTGVIGNGSATREVNLNIGSNTTAHFENGLLLDWYGALVSKGAAATVLLGDGTDAGDLVLSGHNQLLGITAPLDIAASGTGGKITVFGTNNTAHGEIDADGYDLLVTSGNILNVASNETDGLSVNSVTVNGRLDLGTDAYGGTANTIAGGILNTATNVNVASGGSIVANYDDATVTGNGTNSGFTVAKGGSLTTGTASITTSDFDAVAINGSFTAGWDGGDTARLNADSAVTIGKTGSISVTTELAKNAAVDQILIDTRAGLGTITNNANWDYLSMYGKLQFGLDADDQTLRIVGVSNQLTGDRDTDLPLALENLRDMWCPGLIRDDFGALVYDVLEGNVLIADTDAGNKNAALFDAVGNPDAKNVGKSTLDYMSGAHLYGVTDVAIETSRAFVSDIAARAKALHCNFVGDGSVASGEALADTAMNSNYRNRLWADAHGYWQTGDTRGCFSGYSYDASGFTIGYDRVIHPNLAIGMAGAYNDGDFKDKGALAHDSKIESFSAGAYGTYSYPSGVYVTAYGGYTYSDNNLRELRNDPSTLDGSNSWAVSDFRTETWNGGLNAGYDFRCGGLTLTPSVGINYVQARNSDHSSYLGDVATQKIRNARNRGVYLPAELGIQYDTVLSNGGRLRLEVNGAYAYNLRKSGLSGFIDYIDVEGGGAGIASPDNVRHSYKAGGGVRYAYRQYDIGARYDYIGKSGYTAHRFSATLGMSF